MLFCYLQPPFIGLLLFSLTRQGLLNRTYLTSLRFIRKKAKGARYFECAVYPRLVGRLKYDLQVLSFVLIFVLYDVDLVFFYSEILTFDTWAPSQALLFAVYAVFFVGGLAYDIIRQGLNWAY